MKITNIIWDADGEDIDYLPKKIDIGEDEIADWLSDHFGFCVESFVIEKD